MPLNQINKMVISAANEACQKAFEKLISEGIPPEVAEQKVKSNFVRVNKNPNLILSVEELCK